MYTCSTWLLSLHARVPVRRASLDFALERRRYNDGPAFTRLGVSTRRWTNNVPRTAQNWNAAYKRPQSVGHTTFNKNTHRGWTFSKYLCVSSWIQIWRKKRIVCRGPLRKSIGNAGVKYQCTQGASYISTSFETRRSEDNYKSRVCCVNWACSVLPKKSMHST